MIAEAARRKADLVVLGECVTMVGNGLSPEKAAEVLQHLREFLKS